MRGVGQRERRGNLPVLIICFCLTVGKYSSTPQYSRLLQTTPGTASKRFMLILGVGLGCDSAVKLQ